MQCFSVRRLSPFRGTVQIIDVPEARAFSNNGRTWQIQIKHHLAKPKWGSLENIISAQKFVRYGLWNEHQGLSRFPVPPTLDVDRVNQLGNDIIHMIYTHQEQLPFMLIDRFEHWLLDRESLLPAALVASTTEKERIDKNYTPEWQARNSEMPVMEYNEELFENLERLVTQKAGQPPLSQWFVRHPDGSGEGLFGHRLNQQAELRTLSAEKFPAILLRDDWQDEELDKLVEQYACWQAPYLLTLTTISSDQRKHLETVACRKPLLVYELYRLYPEIIQKKLVKRAIVEAQLRLTND